MQCRETVVFKMSTLSSRGPCTSAWPVIKPSVISWKDLTRMMSMKNTKEKSSHKSTKRSKTMSGPIRTESTKSSRNQFCLKQRIDLWRCKAKWATRKFMSFRTSKSLMARSFCAAFSTKMESCSRIWTRLGPVISVRCFMRHSAMSGCSLINRLSTTWEFLCVAQKSTWLRLTIKLSRTLCPKKRTALWAQWSLSD